MKVLEVGTLASEKIMTLVVQLCCLNHDYVKMLFVTFEVSGMIASYQLK